MSHEGTLGNRALCCPRRVRRRRQRRRHRRRLVPAHRVPRERPGRDPAEPGSHLPLLRAGRGRAGLRRAAEDREHGSRCELELLARDRHVRAERRPGRLRPEAPEQGGPERRWLPRGRDLHGLPEGGARRAPLRGGRADLAPAADDLRHEQVLRGSVPGRPAPRQGALRAGLDAAADGAAHGPLPPRPASWRGGPARQRRADRRGALRRAGCRRRAAVRDAVALRARPLGAARPVHRDDGQRPAPRDLQQRDHVGRLGPAGRGPRSVRHAGQLQGADHGHRAAVGPRERRLRREDRGPAARDARGQHALPARLRRQHPRDRLPPAVHRAERPHRRRRDRDLGLDAVPGAGRPRLHDRVHRARPAGDHGQALAHVRPARRQHRPGARPDHEQPEQPQHRALQPGRGPGHGGRLPRGVRERHGRQHRGRHRDRRRSTRATRRTRRGQALQRLRREPDQRLQREHASGRERSATTRGSPSS